MMNKIKLNLSFVFVLVLSVQIYANDTKAYEIVRKSDLLMRGKTNKAIVSMTVQRPTWSRTVKMKTWSKGTEYSLVLITAPARDKGTVFLKRKNEVWNWLPTIERTMKIPPSMMMTSWMGSDFTNDDLVKESSIVQDYTHTIIGDSVINGYSCYKIKLIPKPDAPVVWGKVLLWVEKNNYFQTRIEFYDEENYLINVLRLSDIKKFGDRQLPAHLEMIPQDKKNQKTILDYKSIEFNKPIKDNFFSFQNMKRIR